MAGRRLSGLLESLSAETRQKITSRIQDKGGLSNWSKNEFFVMLATECPELVLTKSSAVSQFMDSEFNRSAAPPTTAATATPAAATATPAAVADTAADTAASTSSTAPAGLVVTPTVLTVTPAVTAGTGGTVAVASDSPAETKSSPVASSSLPASTSNSASVKAPSSPLEVKSSNPFADSKPSSNPFSSTAASSNPFSEPASTKSQSSTGSNPFVDPIVTTVTKPSASTASSTNPFAKPAVTTTNVASASASNPFADAAVNTEVKPSVQETSKKTNPFDKSSSVAEKSTSNPFDNSSNPFADGANTSKSSPAPGSNPFLEKTSSADGKQATTVASTRKSDPLTTAAEPATATKKSDQKPQPLVTEAATRKSDPKQAPPPPSTTTAEPTPSIAPATASTATTTTTSSKKAAPPPPIVVTAPPASTSVKPPTSPGSLVKSSPRSLNAQGSPKLPPLSLANDLKVAGGGGDMKRSTSAARSLAALGSVMQRPVTTPTSYKYYRALLPPELGGWYFVHKSDPSFTQEQVHREILTKLLLHRKLLGVKVGEAAVDLGVLEILVEERESLPPHPDYIEMGLWMAARFEQSLGFVPPSFTLTENNGFEGVAPAEFLDNSAIEVAVTHAFHYDLKPTPPPDEATVALFIHQVRLASSCSTYLSSLILQEFPGPLPSTINIPSYIVTEEIRRWVISYHAPTLDSSASMLQDRVRTLDGFSQLSQSLRASEEFELDSKLLVILLQLEDFVKHARPPVVVACQKRLFLENMERFANVSSSILKHSVLFLYMCARDHSHLPEVLPTALDSLYKARQGEKFDQKTDMSSADWSLLHRLMSSQAGVNLGLILDSEAVHRVLGDDYNITTAANGNSDSGGSSSSSKSINRRSSTIMTPVLTTSDALDELELYKNPFVPCSFNNFVKDKYEPGGLLAFFCQSPATGFVFARLHALLFELAKISLIASHCSDTLFTTASATNELLELWDELIGMIKLSISALSRKSEQFFQSWQLADAKRLLAQPLMKFLKERLLTDIELAGTYLEPIETAVHTVFVLPPFQKFVVHLKQVLVVLVEPTDDAKESVDEYTHQATKYAERAQELLLKGQCVEGTKCLRSGLDLCPSSTKLRLGFAEAVELQQYASGEFLRKNEELHYARRKPPVDDELLSGICKHISSAPCCWTLRILELDDNEISPEGTHQLFRVLPQCPALKRLSIPKNVLGDKGAVALAEILNPRNTHNTPFLQSLQHLDISSCDIHTEGALALAQALSFNTTLKTFDCGYNAIEEEGVCAIVKAVASNKQLSLDFLGLNATGLGVKSATALISLLRENQTIDMSLGDESLPTHPGIHKDIWTELKQLLKTNRSHMPFVAKTTSSYSEDEQLQMKKISTLYLKIFGEEQMLPSTWSLTENEDGEKLPLYKIGLHDCLRSRWLFSSLSFASSQKPFFQAVSTNVLIMLSALCAFQTQRQSHFATTISDRVMLNDPVALICEEFKVWLTKDLLSLALSHSLPNTQIGARVYGRSFQRTVNLPVDNTLLRSLRGRRTFLRNVRKVEELKNESLSRLVDQLDVSLTQCLRVSELFWVNDSLIAAVNSTVGLGRSLVFSLIVHVRKLADLPEECPSLTLPAELGSLLAFVQKMFTANEMAAPGAVSLYTFLKSNFLPILFPDAGLPATKVDMTDFDRSWNPFFTGTRFGHEVKTEEPTPKLSLKTPASASSAASGASSPRSRTASPLPSEQIPKLSLKTAPPPPKQTQPEPKLSLKSPQAKVSPLPSPKSPGRFNALKAVLKRSPKEEAAVNSSNSKEPAVNPNELTEVDFYSTCGLAYEVGRVTYFLLEGRDLLVSQLAGRARLAMHIANLVRIQSGLTKLVLDQLTKFDNKTDLSGLQPRPSEILEPIMNSVSYYDVLRFLDRVVDTEQELGSLEIDDENQGARLDLSTWEPGLPEAPEVQVWKESVRQFCGQCNTVTSLPTNLVPVHMMLQPALPIDPSSASVAAATGSVWMSERREIRRLLKEMVFKVQEQVGDPVMQTKAESKHASIDQHIQMDIDNGEEEEVVIESSSSSSSSSAVFTPLVVETDKNSERSSGLKDKDGGEGGRSMKKSESGMKKSESGMKKSESVLRPRATSRIAQNMEGWLWKLTRESAFPRWVKRYFVLKDHCLAYWDSDKEYKQGKVAGKRPLSLLGGICKACDGLKYKCESCACVLRPPKTGGECVCGHENVTHISSKNENEVHLPKGKWAFSFTPAPSMSEQSVEIVSYFGVQLESELEEWIHVIEVNCDEKSLQRTRKRSSVTNSTPFQPLKTAALPTLSEAPVVKTKIIRKPPTVMNLPCQRLVKSDIDDKGILLLADEIIKKSKENMTAFYIDVSFNWISEEGINKFIKTIHTSTQTHHIRFVRFALRNNTLNDKGIEYISKQLITNVSFQRLTYLDVNSNNITATGVKYLSDLFLQNGPLVYLDLGYNSIGDAGVNCLCNALKEAPLARLKTLHLGGCDVSSAAARHLRSMVNYNINLTELFLHENYALDMELAESIEHKLFPRKARKEPLASFLWSNPHAVVPANVKAREEIVNVDIRTFCRRCEKHFDGVMKAKIGSSELQEHTTELTKLLRLFPCKVQQCSSLFTLQESERSYVRVLELLALASLFASQLGGGLKAEKSYLQQVLFEGDFRQELSDWFTMLSEQAGLIVSRCAKSFSECFEEEDTLLIECGFLLHASIEEYFTREHTGDYKLSAQFIKRFEDLRVASQWFYYLQTTALQCLFPRSKPVASLSRPQTITWKGLENVKGEENVHPEVLQTLHAACEVRLAPLFALINENSSSSSSNNEKRKENKTAIMEEKEEEEEDDDDDDFEIEGFHGGKVKEEKTTTTATASTATINYTAIIECMKTLVDDLLIVHEEMRGWFSMCKQFEILKFFQVRYHIPFFQILERARKGVTVGECLAWIRFIAWYEQELKEVEAESVVSLFQPYLTDFFQMYLSKQVDTTQAVVNNAMKQEREAENSAQQTKGIWYTAAPSDIFELVGSTISSMLTLPKEVLFHGNLLRLCMFVTSLLTTMQHEQQLYIESASVTHPKQVSSELGNFVWFGEKKTPKGYILAQINNASHYEQFFEDSVSTPLLEKFEEAEKPTDTVQQDKQADDRANIEEYFYECGAAFMDLATSAMDTTVALLLALLKENLSKLFTSGMSQKFWLDVSRQEVKENDDFLCATICQQITEFCEEVINTLGEESKARALMKIALHHVLALYAQAFTKCKPAVGKHHSFVKLVQRDMTALQKCFGNFDLLEDDLIETHTIHFSNLIDGFLNCEEGLFSVFFVPLSELPIVVGREAPSAVSVLEQICRIREMNVLQKTELMNKYVADHPMNNNNNNSSNTNSGGSEGKNSSDGKEDIRKTAQDQYEKIKQRVADARVGEKAGKIREKLKSSAKR